MKTIKYRDILGRARRERPLPPMIYPQTMLKQIYTHFYQSSDEKDSLARMEMRAYFSGIGLTEEQIKGCFIELSIPYIQTTYPPVIAKILSSDETITAIEEQSLIHEAYVKLLAHGIGGVITMEVDGVDTKFKSHLPNAKAMLDAFKIRDELAKMMSSKNYETFEEMENRYKEIYKDENTSKNK